MVKYLKKYICTSAVLLVSALPVLADFKEHFDLGQQYLSNYQYSGAVTEFKSALRINYLDNSARIGLINSYLARGTYYANTDKDYAKAADDYRAALFYLLYYPNENQVRNSSQAIVQVTSNLNKCLNEINFLNVVFSLPKFSLFIIESSCAAFSERIFLKICIFPEKLRVSTSINFSCKSL